MGLGRWLQISSSPSEVTFQDHTRLNLSAVVEPLTAPKLASRKIKTERGFANVFLWGQVASRGSLTLTRRQRGHRVVLGRSRFTLRARRTKMVRVRLSRSAAWLLADAGKLNAVAAVRAKDPLGRVRLRAVGVTITRVRRPHAG